MENLTEQVIKKIEEVHDIKVNVEAILDSVKEDNTDQTIIKLRDRVNTSYYKTFKQGIKHKESILLNGEDLRRVSGKTTTMVLLALIYDLPLLVSSSYKAGQLRGVYGGTKLKFHSSLSEDAVDSDIILLDEGSLDRARYANGNKVYIGIKL